MGSQDLQNYNAGEIFLSKYPAHEGLLYCVLTSNLSKPTHSEPSQKKKNSQRCFLNLCVGWDCLLISWFICFIRHKKTHRQRLCMGFTRIVECLFPYLIIVSGHHVTVCVVCVCIFVCELYSPPFFFIFPPQRASLPLWFIYAISKGTTSLQHLWLSVHFTAQHCCWSASP